LLGQATEKKTHRSYSGSGLFLTSRTESEQEFGRPLLTPAEVNQLPEDEGMLLVGGLLPYRARKVRYFLDPRFQGRDALPPPDRAEEQARERLGFAANDWEGPDVVSPPSEPSGLAAVCRLPTAPALGPPFDDEDPPDSDAAPMTGASPSEQAACAVTEEEVRAPSFVASGPSIRAAHAAEAADVPAGKNEKEIPL
jgi:hypothetical protein